MVHSPQWRMDTSAHGDQSDQDATHSGEWTTSAHGDQSDQDATHSDPHLLMEIRCDQDALTVENGHICSWRSE